MTENRLSFLTPAETESAIRAAAEEAGKTVDEWLTELSQQKIDGLNRAKREKAQAEADQDEGYRAALWLVEDYEARYGPIPEEVWREANAFIDSLDETVENDAETDAADAHGMADR